MPNSSLSPNANKALDLICHKYQARLISNRDNNICNYNLRSFTISSLFSNQDDNEIMSTILELEQNNFVKLFSDRRILINNEYIQNRLQDNPVKHNFKT